MASGRNSKVIRILARELTESKAGLETNIKFGGGIFHNGSANTEREIVIGKDAEGEDIVMTTRTLSHPAGTYRRVLKTLKKAYRTGELQIG